MTLEHTLVVLEQQNSQRQSIDKILSKQLSFRVLSYVLDVDEAKTQLKRYSPDVILVSLNLPANDVNHLIQWVKCSRLSTEVMVIADEPDSSALVMAARAGATGFMLRRYLEPLLVSGIKQMLGGGSHIHPKIARTLLSELVNLKCDIPSQSKKDHTLTPRERDILAFVAKGFTASEIAESLRISSHTVSSHVKNLYKKLSIHTRGEAVIEAIRLGVIDAPSLSQYGT